jgi:transcriptional regulator with XRE-family HTH domain
MMKHTTLAERIQLGMVHGGVASQSDLARRMKINRQTVNRWATGEGTRPEPEMLIKLADAMKVSIRWLVTGMGEMGQGSYLTHKETEILNLWRSLPPAAKEHWASQGRDLAALLGPNSANNPFGPRRI